MSKKIGFLQRWMFIIDKISTQPYISREELISAFQEELIAYDGATNVGTASRTLDRDLGEIRSSSYMDISIEYSRARGGYYIPQNEKSLSKLDRLFELSSLLSFSTLKDVVFVENRQSWGLEYRFGIVNAIRKSVEIIIDYGKFDSPSTRRERRLRPYALREFKNRWYLLAMEVNAKEGCTTNIKIWGLDRIKKLTATNCIFEKDETVNLTEVFEHCFGIYANKDIQPEKVVLSFTPLSGNYIKSCPLHKTQETIVDNENEVRIQLTVKLTRDFITELLGHSENMWVIKPRHLKDKLIDIHQKAIEQLSRKR